MPLVTNTSLSTTVAANTAMSGAFFPRTKSWIYPSVCGQYTSTRLVEPHALLGSAPPMALYSGKLKSRRIPSFRMDVPNLLFKNIIEIDQTEYEGDQTRTLLLLSQAIGVRVAEFPDQLFAMRLLNGSAATCMTSSFRGQDYTLTLDGAPMFSANHNDYFSGSVQSNIIAGELPSGGTAALLEQDWATTATQMQRDLQATINRIKTIKDTAGVQMFPTMETKKSIVLLVPPALEPAAALAFKTASSVINQTTNIAPMFVKDVLSSGYFAGFTNPETGAAIAPVNELDYYVAVVEDWVRPFYVQMFRPINDNELAPPGYSATAEMQRILKKDSTITVPQATLWASTRVDSTFNKIGDNADQATIQSEAFWVSARFRGNITYGPWFTLYRVKPQGGS